MYDTVIVGGGLAGSCAALFLSLEERVLLLEALYRAWTLSVGHPYHRE